MTFPSFEDRAAPRSFYPAVTVDVIFERIAKGETLLSVCTDPQMPCRRTLYVWLREPSLSARYQQAVQQGIRARTNPSASTSTSVISAIASALTSKD